MKVLKHVWRMLAICRKWLHSFPLRKRRCLPLTFRGNHVVLFSTSWDNNPKWGLNSSIFNLFILFLVERMLQKTHFRIGTSQLPGCLLLDWLSDKIIFLKENLKFQQYLLLTDHCRRKFWAVSTYGPIIHCYVIAHGLSIITFIIVGTLSAIACFEHPKLSVRVNL